LTGDGCNARNCGLSRALMLWSQAHIFVILQVRLASSSLRELHVRRFATEIRRHRAFNKSNA
jgi:hypothetical protein